jgi:Ion channel
VPTRIVSPLSVAFSTLSAFQVEKVEQPCALVGAVPEQVDAFYFAFVNYTTLGYGDILPIPRWRILGPMAAMNGILLFGWSTAVIYDVLRTIAQVIPMKAEDG